MYSQVKNRVLLDAVLVASVSILFLVCLNAFYFSTKFETVYIGISSESLVQTIPAINLKEKPFSSLYFNHIQPPIFDGVRAAIAFFWNSDDGSLTKFVDEGVYYLYILLFGVLSSLVFLWILKATSSRVFASAGALLWILHPAPISMAAFLDGTFLSSVFITWMMFEIWLMPREGRSIGRLILAASLCFLTRAHFQWFFVPVLGLALLLIGVDRRRLIFGMTIFVFVVGLYCTKQFLLFGTVQSYGFYGDKLTGLLWIEEVGEIKNDTYRENCGGKTMSNEVECKKFLAEHFPSDLAELKYSYPEGARSISGGYNTEDRWWLSHITSRIAKRYCVDNLGHCVASLGRSINQNFPEYWIESWDRENPVVADTGGIPWVRTYYRIVHKYPWLLLGGVVVVIITMVGRRDRTYVFRTIGISIVPMYVFSITLLGNVYDAFEGGRLKFLLEPTLYTFFLVQVFYAVKIMIMRGRIRGSMN